MSRLRLLSIAIISAILLSINHSSLAQVKTDFKTCLVAGGLVRGGRNLLHSDPVEAMLIAGNPILPAVGEAIGNAKWAEARANKDGWFESPAFSGGYAYISVPSEKDQVVILEAAGHTLVYVNGTPRTGDPYSNGYVRLPLSLRKGENSLLFLVGRGRLRASIKTFANPLLLDASDATLPDFRLGEALKTSGALVAINASNDWKRGLKIMTETPEGKRLVRNVPALPPASVRKIAIGIEGPAPKTAEAKKYSVYLADAAGVPISEAVEFNLRVRKQTETYKRTFISQIDGSVQYFAVNPASDYVDRKSGAPSLPPPALVLSLHGASVEGLGQADAYASKSWAHLVAPTNRRPYGFDWEEWGRLDALEVLDLAQKELKTDPARTYLTGHSMGGHGTWQVGVQYPDKFAALAPSAGWVSFFSYAGTQKSAAPSPMEAILQRSTNSSDTLALSHNYAQQSIYILHGDADDNVPISEARTMATHLAGFHKDFQIHEQPGAGHWWSEGDEAGARCVDYPGFFDLFSKRRIPSLPEVRHIDFTTANPEVSSRCHWATIEQQIKPLEISSVELTLDPHIRRFSGTTKNVKTLKFNLNSLAGAAPASFNIDGVKLEKLAIPADRSITLVRDGASWIQGRSSNPGQKNALRSGNFKAAFNHRFQFVVGTKGTFAENEWALAKAKFDAESFWYRGNGSVDILLDTEFNPAQEPDRSVILYGNAETNGAWDSLLKGTDIEVRRGVAVIGKEKFEGENLAILFLKPRSGSSTACVGAISGTGIVGMKLADRIPIFLSGVGIPDLIALSPESLSEGAKGVKAAGFFGNDWSVENGEFTFNR